MDTLSPGASCQARRVLREKSQSCGGWALIWQPGEMVELGHISVASRFFSNATQNPLPPGGMPSGLPEQDKLYLHRRPGSYRVEMPSLIHKQQGTGPWPPPGIVGKTNSTWVVCCVLPLWRIKNAGRKDSNSFTSFQRLFGSLIPGGPYRAHGLRWKLGKAL